MFDDFVEKTRLKRFSAAEIGLARHKPVQRGEPVQPRFWDFLNSFILKGLKDVNHKKLFDSHHWIKTNYFRDL